MKFHSLITLSCLLISLWINEVNAACRISFPDNSSRYTLNSNVDLGMISVKPSDTIGQVLKSVAVAFSDMNIALATSCSGTSSLSSTFEKPFPLSILGNRIYNTNIEGIGVRINIQGKALLSVPGTINIAAGANIYGSDVLVIQMIKTSNALQSGILESGRYAQWAYSGVSIPKHVLNLTGSVTVTAPTCTWITQADRLINLATVSTAMFAGIGSTAAEQAFQLDLNCNGGPGGTVSLVFDFMSRPENSAIIQNTSLAAQKAQGIDLQLLSTAQGSQNVISKGAKLSLAKLAANQTQTLNVPLTARYYQSDAQISAGEVRGQITVTVEYQ